MSTLLVLYALPYRSMKLSLFFLLMMGCGGCGLSSVSGPNLRTASDSACGGLKLEGGPPDTLPELAKQFYPRVEVSVCAKP